MQSQQDIAAERQLWKAFCTGDDTALDVIYRRYIDRLYRDARRYVSDEQAHDIVHDVFATLVARRTYTRPHGSLRLYLHTAVRNRARDVLARTQTEERRLSESGDFAWELQHRTLPHADSELLLEELTQILASAIASCGPRAREVLLLSEEIRRYAEIGTQLGISPNTVHNVLTRTRHRLRDIVHNAGWDQSPPRRRSRHP